MYVHNFAFGFQTFICTHVLTIVAIGHVQVEPCWHSQCVLLECSSSKIK